MSTNKYIDRICIIVMIVAIVLTAAFMNGENLGIAIAERVMGYEDKIFDTSYVHTMNIEIDDWEGFLETATQEEYAMADITIDGEVYKNTAIRAKGNTSLTQVASYGNNRYSFKLEFDHYDSALTYHGLDKMSLNNIIQDNTYMKDYLSYQLMYEMGADAPLCSFVYITVNGEEWGLYLAVEGVEDSFLERNYGTDYGELYKPDSMSMGGGRGQGKEFNMDDFDFSDIDTSKFPSGDFDMSNIPEMPEGFDSSNMPDMSNMQNMQMPDMPEGFDPTKIQGGNFEPSSNTDKGNFGEGESNAKEKGSSTEKPSGNFDPSSETGKGNFGGGQGGNDKGGFGGGGMGSDDVKLIYTDDDFDSYSNIFENAKTDITKADKTRLIESLKNLNEQSDIESVVDIEEVINYFVVHNFTVNMDSYTGSMIHNYYLYEEDGKFSMIPWDYNLAFGGFMSSSSATSVVNDPIDSPVSGGSTDDRPMIAWIFSNEEYLEMYHERFQDFVDEYLTSGKMEKMIEDVKEMIAPYVEKDPTKFCTYEEFITGIDTLKEVCVRRLQSIEGQLNGTIPSTSEGQTQDSSSLIDASDLTVSDMGTMGNGMGGGGGFSGKGDRPGQSSEKDENQAGNESQTQEPSNQDQNQQNPGQSQQGQMPEGFSGGGFNGQMPSDFSGQMPEAPSQGGFGGGQMPEGFSGGNFNGQMPEGSSGGGFNGQMPSDFPGKQSAATNNA